MDNDALRAIVTGLRERSIMPQVYMSPAEYLKNSLYQDIAEILTIELEQRVTEIGAQVEQLSIDVQAMQARADSNRDNAATLYGDVLYFGCYRRECNGRSDAPTGNGKCHAGEEGATAWRRRDNSKRVVFTPYGWVDEPE